MVTERYVYTVRNEDGMECGRAGRYMNNRCLPFATRAGATALASRYNKKLHRPIWRVVTYRLVEMAEA